MKSIIEKDIIFASKCSKKCSKSENIFYKRFYDPIYRICLKYSRNKMEAEDMTHDCFINLLTKIGSYRGTGPLEGWVRRAAVNFSITFYHKKKLEGYHSDVDLCYSLEDASLREINSNFTREDLSKAIEELPDGYKKIFKLYAIDGYMHKEISEMLGITINTSKSQFWRGRAELIKKIQKIGYYGTT